MLTTLILAAQPHFVVGPTITTGASTVTACGKIAGLGNNQQIKIVLAVTATTTCTNRGGQVPPGLTETLVGSIDATSDKNGTVTFCVTTESATNPCPNPMRPTTSFSDFSIRVFDAAGNQILP
jgi:hypothetical protein